MDQVNRITGRAAPAPVGGGCPERQPKLSRIAYARFKESLFARRIPIGATVTQAELVELLEVPIGPLREALQVLENDGLLTMLPRSGIRIVKPGMSLMKDSFQLRRILELEAVRKYAEGCGATNSRGWRRRIARFSRQRSRGWRRTR